MSALRASIPFLFLLCFGTVTARAEGKPKLHESVTYAPTWEAAVEEAKLLNVPIVIHNHGFNCPPCWGMHAGLLQNKRYVAFAEKNTVEVIVLGQLDAGIASNHERAAEYETEVDGEKVKCMVEFPGMTRDQMLALGKSPAAQYNKTGGVPYTCIVDPHTLAEMHAWSGGQSAKSVMDGIDERVAALKKEHGPGMQRKALRKLDEAEADARVKTGGGDFAAAIRILEKAGRKSAEWPESLQQRVGEARAVVVRAAGKALDDVESVAKEDAKEARRQLLRIKGKLRGTGLEERVETLLQGLSKKP